MLVGALRAACDEMGAVLIRAAHSPNIKERHDCSTALFDADAELVMQAEHIPVHLGSMPDAVAVIASEEQRPGDLWILNDPFAGGTHLPDITLISPLFEADELLGFAASRAHHADIGGPTPGGMPADSRRLEDEGVVIPPTRADDEALAELAGRMRNPAERIADLRAQRAANLTGARRVAELVERLGAEGLRAGMAEILDYAERRTRASIAEVADGIYEAQDVLEAGPDGSEDARLYVRATVDGDRLELDFEGTDPQLDGNLNCPLSVTRSAAFFAVRVLIDPDAPPSAGAHRPIDVRAPEGCLLNARRPAAVVGGNVETSSRVADLVIEALAGALPAPAQGQGTMNNLTLADEHFTYYETLGGGQGACPDADGPERDPRGDVEHPQHPGGGVRARLPRASPRALDPARKRWRGRPPRRRRPRPRARGAVADALHADHRAAAPQPSGARRGRRWRSGAQPAERRGAAVEGDGRAGAGRPPAHRDPGRRWFGQVGQGVHDPARVACEPSRAWLYIA